MTHSIQNGIIPSLQDYQIEAVVFGGFLSADDVVYTINTVIQDKKVSVPSNYNFYESAVKIDDLRVRVKLKRIFPAALEYMSMVLPIWPKA